MDSQRHWKASGHKNDLGYTESIRNLYGLWCILVLLEEDSDVATSPCQTSARMCDWGVEEIVWPPSHPWSPRLPLGHSLTLKQTRNLIIMHFSGISPACFQHSSYMFLHFPASVLHFPCMFLHFCVFSAFVQEHFSIFHAKFANIYDFLKQKTIKSIETHVFFNNSLYFTALKTSKIASLARAFWSYISKFLTSLKSIETYCRGQCFCTSPDLWNHKKGNSSLGILFFV